MYAVFLVGVHMGGLIDFEWSWRMGRSWTTFPFYEIL